jgi:hypothetical protein
MNYIDAIVARLAELLPGCPTDLLRGYAVLARVKGADTTEEDVHDMWSAWQAATQPEHRSLIPFEQLSREVQALDAKYAEAIRAVAS